MKQFARSFTAAVMGIGLMLVAAPLVNAATSDGVTAKRKAVSAQVRDRSGEYQMAGKRSRRRARNAVGIAVGVAAAAIIINEAAKAERRRKARARHGAHCHSKVRVHSHRAIDGRGPHRHNKRCTAYIVYPRDDDDDVAVAPEPRCDEGFEYIDGKCYRNEELDDRPAGDGRQASVDEDAAYARCARQYRSFRYEDGTYQPYGGRPRRLCPYLE